MLFSSTEFIFYFLPCVLIVYYFLFSVNSPRLAKAWLAGASLFFYGYWKPLYLPLILASVLINFLISYLILRRQHNAPHDDTKSTYTPKFSSKALLIIGILFNVGLIGFFKYFDFFIENFSLLLAIKDPFQLNVLLPLGISFFTFQQIAYLVDCHKGLIKQHNIVNYFLFVTFFPQLIAGPIVHHQEMMPQFENKDKPYKNLPNLSKGIFLFSVGFFKKIVIADSLAVWANSGYSALHIHTLTPIDSWCVSLSYTFQLYFDFSGYTDMAMGIALLFGISLPANFNSPYKAINIQEFWQRWHITLSRWLRDYIYIPLGGNRLSAHQGYLNVFIVFIIGGIWHGAGWNFILWGALHGLATLLYRLWQYNSIIISKLFCRISMLLFLNVTWVLFRAETLGDAKLMLMQMFDVSRICQAAVSSTFFSGIIHKITGWEWFLLNKSPEALTNMIDDSKIAAMSFMGLFFFVCFFKNSNEYSKEMESSSMIKLLFIAQLSALLFLTALLFLHIQPTSEFIYFNF